MQPPVFGYMLVRPDASDYLLCSYEMQMEDFADANGYKLEAVFQDKETYSGAMFTLLEHAKQEDVKHIIVPALTHIKPTYNNLLEESGLLIFALNALNLEETS